MRIWCFIFLLVGCGPGSPASDAGPSSSDTGETFAELAVEISNAICSKRLACGCPRVASKPDLWCQDVYTERYDSLFDNVAKGGEIFNRDCFDDRVAAILALTCAERESSILDWETRACRIFEPVMEEPCQPPRLGRWDCSGNRWCSACGSFLGDCDGPCVDDAAFGAEGKSCKMYERSRARLCESGLVCDLSGRCRVGPAEGESCPAPGETAVIPCAEGFCDCGGYPCDPIQDGANAGICRDFLPIGEPCVADEQCEFRCNEGICAEAVPLACDELTFESF